MEPETPTPVSDISPDEVQPAEWSANAPVSPESGGHPVPEPPGGLRWVFMGPQGLRAGWSVAIFVAIFGGTATGLRLMAEYVQKMAPHAAAKGGQSQGMSPWAAASGEGIGVLFLLLVMWIMSLIERRDVLDYNLRGPRILAHFAQGVGCGFLALSALIGALTAGGWLHFAGLALSGPQIVLYAAVWGGAFLLVGCMEEGMFRCYLQFTLARGINFWWALGLVGAICGELLWRGKGNGIWGVYIIASLGLIPCAWLYLNKLAGNGFWQATWVTSTLFGFVHTGNNGENWIGIFSAAAIGAVFCVSIRLTGSAWWAIGCHAAWDWGQTYFYGVADSGLPAAGHLLNSIVPATANAFWSGGKDGPEGSVLVIPTVVLILLLLVILYARRSRAPASITIEQTAG